MNVRLKELRGETGLSQPEYGEIFGITRVTVSHYETGERKPDTDLLCKIADYHKTTVDYILGRSNNRSLDEHLQGMSIATGISDKAINLLTGIRKDKLQPICETFPATINFLLETEAGQKVLTNIWEFRNFKESEKNAWIVKSTDGEFAGDLSDEQYRQVFLVNIITELNNTL